jgi:hypothetical protein
VLRASLSDAALRVLCENLRPDVLVMQPCGAIFFSLTIQFSVGVIETVLRKSGELADLEAVAQSWFEDGLDIVQAIAGARARNRAKVVTYLLQSVIARHRDKWADLLLRTASWMREAPGASSRSLPRRSPTGETWPRLD